MTNKSKVVAVLTARMASTRLPGKVLLPLDERGRTSLWWTHHRVMASGAVDVAVVAVAEDGAGVGAIVDYCNAVGGIPIFVAPVDENDVLGRIHWVAEYLKADVVVEVTPDCPLVDPEMVDRIVRMVTLRGAAYSSNVYPSRTFPDGLDVQACTMGVLNLLNKVAPCPRENGLWNFTDHMVSCSVDGIEVYWDSYVASDQSPLAHPEWRWTLDTPEDLKSIRRITRYFEPDTDFTAWEIAQYWTKHREGK